MSPCSTTTGALLPTAAVEASGTHSSQGPQKLCPPWRAPSGLRSWRGQRQPLVPCPETQVCDDEDGPRSIHEVKISNVRSESGGNGARHQHSYNVAAAEAWDKGSSWDKVQRLQTRLLTAFYLGLQRWLGGWSISPTRKGWGSWDCLA